MLKQARANAKADVEVRSIVTVAAMRCVVVQREYRINNNVEFPVEFKQAGSSRSFTHTVIALLDIYDTFVDSVL